MRDTGFNLNLSNLESSNVYNSLEEKSKARTVVCNNADNIEEARLFLYMLDLIPQEHIPVMPRHGMASPNSRLGRELAAKKREKSANNEC